MTIPKATGSFKAFPTPTPTTRGPLWHRCDPSIVSTTSEEDSRIHTHTCPSPLLKESGSGAKVQGKRVAPPTSLIHGKCNRMSLQPYDQAYIRNQMTNLCVPLALLFLSWWWLGAISLCIRSLSLLYHSLVFSDYYTSLFLWDFLEGNTDRATKNVYIPWSLTKYHLWTLQYYDHPCQVMKK